MNFSAQEASKIQAYLQKKFNSPGLTLRARGKTDDSVEMLLDGEFMGVIYKDDEDGETSYNVNMTILGIDLEDAA